MLVDWLDFYDSAVKEGWKLSSIFKRIESSVGDVFGPKHRDEVIKRLQFCLKKRNESV